MTTAPTTIQATPGDLARAVSLLLHVARGDAAGQRLIINEISHDGRVIEALSAFVSIVITWRPEIVTDSSEQRTMEATIASLLAEQQQLDDVAIENNSDDDSSKS